MKGRFPKSIIAGAIAIVTTASSPMFAQEPTASPLIKQLNNGNWLPQKEAETLRDELFYQRAVHAYMTMLPALNIIGMRDGSEATFGKGYNVLPIWKDRMDSRAWVPTPNADVIYSMSYLDLKETGPLVVAAPPNVIGMFTDFFQRTHYRCRPNRAGPRTRRALSPAAAGLRRRDTAGLFRVQIQDLQCFSVLSHDHGERREWTGSEASRRARRTNAHLSAVGRREGRQADAISERQRQARQHDVSDR